MSDKVVYNNNDKPKTSFASVVKNSLKPLADNQKNEEIME